MKLCAQVETLLRVGIGEDERLAVLMEVKVLVYMHTYQHASL